MMTIGTRVKSLSDDRYGRVERIDPDGSLHLRFVDASYGHKPLNSVVVVTASAYAAVERAALRNNPALTAARYDEILALRMLLLDVMDRLESEEDDSQYAALRARILKRSRTWGKKGDCA